ncbi:ferritin-like domain-containing protein [Geodermatophilus sp. URMC 64]
MLRLRRIDAESAPRARTALEAPAPLEEIIRDFADPYLELVRLLREASEIEHALLVQYLYGAYSLKPAYAGVRGAAFPSPNSLLGVAIQEMQHLEQVNRMLQDLGAAPNLVRQDFPYEPDIYPFALNLEPLSPQTLAKYVFTEAPASALDPDDPGNADPATQEFLSRLQAALGNVRPNHLGSLYTRIIEVTEEVIAAAVPGVADLSAWPQRLATIKGEGEQAHFRFFKSVFLGTHAGFGGHADVWSLPPGDPAYPSVDLGTNPSAFEAHPNAIPEDGSRRRLAWLSDLHYWLVLGLLDLGYRTQDPTISAQAKQHMLLALHPLGEHLATLGVGVPFDPLSMGYAPGRDVAGSVRVLRRMALEAQAVAGELAGVLPTGYATDQSGQTVAALDAIVDGGGVVPSDGGTGTGGGGVAVPPEAQQASDFWFEYDNHFLFQPPAQVIQAYTVLLGVDYVRSRFTFTRNAGTYPGAFLADVTPLEPGLRTLSAEQLAIMDRHFAGDLDRLQSAFEHFGCGDLFDDRRPDGLKVHMMDSSGPANPPIGYHRWHAILRAMTLLGIDADRWNAIDRFVGLAWAIHAEAQPVQDTNNPPLPQARLAALRAHWLALGPDQLDDAFSVFPFPPPVP